MGKSLIKRFITSVTTNPNTAFVFGWILCGVMTITFQLYHNFTGWQPLMCDGINPWLCYK